ncbi:RecQ family ATP-dependent DNA helicase [Microbispora sp. ATCC PTA-5024]|uniref:RecQ family ATP-dependent DNA helicase n=1 Tax=Microbispora sp. ATCC PTA-5024 TaxID=316330 RepID=UPI0003DBB824|nr:RecQ family ATP-dependent DNA helicase [Microbispora sp. ATCC PTA-5024]ETK37522.1 ATP-dependent DNA helicase RecQ [Microbispora sp. ATCC PTA-5024]
MGVTQRFGSRSGGRPGDRQSGGTWGGWTRGWTGGWANGWAGGRFGRRFGRRARALRSTARDAFGWQQLRPGQQEAMEHLLAGRDVLLVMPTGGGKSAVYQVPGLLLDGPTVVVSPLIALQRDQVMSLLKAGAAGAVAVNSAGSVEAGLDQVTAGAAEYVFLSPEQLAKPDVVERLAQARPSLIAVDEAHCVSAWGHDFRPEYLRLGKVIEALGHPPVIAMTATAAPTVREEIVESLGIAGAQQIVRGFDRPNLDLEVRRFTSDDDKRRALAGHAAELEGVGLVYVATRRQAEEYAEALRGRGRRAEPYHAGMASKERRRIHEMFQDDDLDVVVATSAFGMGIDKPDVRYVLHAAPPESLDAYYQEIGRAGRDGNPASAVLFYRPEDLGLRKFFMGGRADEDLMRRLAVVVREHGGEVASAELRELVGVGAAKLASQLNLLERTGAVEVAHGGGLRYADDGPSPEEAAARAMEIDATRHRLEDSRLAMMRGYAETTGCRRRFLLEYFGEPYERACGACDTCRAGTAATPETGDGPYPMHASVRHAEWGHGVVMSREADRITVLFDEVGYKTLALGVVDDVLDLT